MENPRGIGKEERDYPAPLRVVQGRARRELPKTYRNALLDLEAQRLKEEIKISLPAGGVDRVIEARIFGKVFLLRRYVKCGKECKGCPHGPYWYGFYRHKGRFISFYIGKVLAQRFLKAKRVVIAQRAFGKDGV